MMERKARTFRRRIIALVVIVLIVGSLGGIYYIYGNKGGSEPNKVIIKTSMGDITIQLYDDMPITSGNFRNLVKQGILDGTTFDRVVAGFVIQGGNTASKGITVPTIKDELPNRHSNVQWSVAMAKTSQPNSATSQFFINLADNSKNLDSNYSVFGTVIAGKDVVAAIAQVSTKVNPVTGEQSMPLQAIPIIKAEFSS